MNALLALSLGLSVTLGAEAGAAEGVRAPADPSAFFSEQQFLAAAAGFETKWKEQHRPIDGLDAVIAWRNGGRYAHARVLFEEIASTIPAGDPLQGNARLLRERLDELTARVAFDGENVTPDTAVTIDGVAGERLGGDVIVAVGHRAAILEREGCDPYAWDGSLLPSERRVVTAKLVCHRLPGSIHVTLGGGARASVVVDEKPDLIPFQDYEVSLPPGEHHLLVQRMGVTLLERTVDIAPAQRESVELYVPWRARLAGITLSLANDTFFESAGGLQYANGTMLMLGVRTPLGTGGGPEGRVPVMEFDMPLGGAILTSIGGLGGEVWLGMSGGVRNLFGPVLERRLGPALLVVDLEPALVRWGITARGGLFSDVQERMNVFQAGAVVVNLDWAHFHGELQLQPIGATLYSIKDVFQIERSGWAWAPGASLRVGTIFLGQ